MLRSVRIFDECRGHIAAEAAADAGPGEQAVALQQAEGLRLDRAVFSWGSSLNCNCSRSWGVADLPLANLTDITIDLKRFALPSKFVFRKRLFPFRWRTARCGSRPAIRST